MAKPADFYVGVLDVFSILLPGAVVSWTAWVWLGGDPELGTFLPHGEIAPWVAFGLAAFASGHLVFMLASLVDVTVDGFRKRILQRTLSADRRAVDDSAYEAASALRSVSLAAERSMTETGLRAEAWARDILRKRDTSPTIPRPTNTYQWSRAVLRLRAPAALVEVLRLEADSKFFRSLFVVFVLLAICSLIHLPGSERLPLSAAILLPLAGMSYWRYAEQRQKGLAEAYRAVIICLAVGDAVRSSKSREDDDE
jgi:hypothetical protein